MQTGLVYSQCTVIVVKVCEDKPLEVVRVSCEDITTEKCIIVPEVEEVEEEVRGFANRFFVQSVYTVQLFRSRSASLRSAPLSATP